MGHPATLSFILTLTLIHVGASPASAQQNQPRREGRFTFDQFLARHDTNQDRKVERDEFKGGPQFFRWLDQNGDGVVTVEEFQKRTQRDGRQSALPGRRSAKSAWRRKQVGVAGGFHGGNARFALAGNGERVTGLHGVRSSCQTVIHRHRGRGVLRYL